MALTIFPFPLFVHFLADPIQQAYNALELLVYKAQDLAKADKGSADDKKALADTAGAVEAWLEKEGSNASMDDVKAKTSSLEALMAKLTV
jgi:hypothetical protein